MNESDEELDEFYRKHRGGSGSVIIVSAYGDGDERQAVFGSVEAAREWSDALGESWSCIFSPYVVDEPDFGNTVAH